MGFRNQLTILESMDLNHIEDIQHFHTQSWICWKNKTKKNTSPTYPPFLVYFREPVKHLEQWLLNPCWLMISPMKFHP